MLWVATFSRSKTWLRETEYWHYATFLWGDFTIVIQSCTWAYLTWQQHRTNLTETTIEKYRTQDFNALRRNEYANNSYQAISQPEMTSRNEMTRSPQALLLNMRVWAVDDMRLAGGWGLVLNSSGRSIPLLLALTHKGPTKARRIMQAIMCTWWLFSTIISPPWTEKG